MTARKIDHIGINVHDLAAAKAFFLALGFEEHGEGEVSGDWVDRVIGLDKAHSTIVFLRLPDAQTAIELVKFHNPVDERGVQPVPANTLGIRHLAIVVDDVAATIARLHAHGSELVGEVQTYEDVYKMCYVRGPEGIVIELAEELD